MTGDVILGNLKTGTYIKFSDTGIIEIKGKLNIIGDVDITGDLVVSGNITATEVTATTNNITLSTHIHLKGGGSSVQSPTPDP